MNKLIKRLSRQESTEYLHSLLERVVKKRVANRPRIQGALEMVNEYIVNAKRKKIWLNDRLNNQQKNDTIEQYVFSNQVQDYYLKEEKNLNNYSEIIHFIDDNAVRKIQEDLQIHNAGKKRTNQVDELKLDFYAIYLGYFGFLEFKSVYDQENLESFWESPYQKSVSHKKSDDNNERKAFMKQVSQLLLAQYSSKYLIEERKKIIGLSGIERAIDFHLILKSKNIHLDCVIGVHYSDTKVSLLEIEGMILKSRDCRSSKAGIVTNIGFEASATKFGIDNNLLMIVVPGSYQMEYVSYLKGEIKNIKNQKIAYILTDMSNGNNELPPFLKKRICEFHFGIGLDNQTSFNLYGSLS